MVSKGCSRGSSNKAKNLTFYVSNVYCKLRHCTNMNSVYYKMYLWWFNLRVLVCDLLWRPPFSVRVAEVFACFVFSLGQPSCGRVLFCPPES